jgi:hypothetical protein
LDPNSNTTPKFHSPKQHPKESLGLEKENQRQSFDSSIGPNGQEKDFHQNFAMQRMFASKDKEPTSRNQALDQHKTKSLPLHASKANSTSRQELEDLLDGVQVVDRRRQNQGQEGGTYSSWQ